MEKDRIKLIILLIPFLLVILALISVKATFFAKFLAISVFFGPGMAITYGLDNPLFSPRRHLFFLLILEALSVALLYSIMRLLPSDIRFNNRILRKLNKEVKENKDNVIVVTQKLSDRFITSFGERGFYMSLALMTFGYGPYIAAIVAYFLGVKLNKAIIAIAIGAAVSIVFWWYLALGAIPFVTPTLVFVITTSLSIIFLVYAWFKENQMVARLSYTLLDTGDILTKEVLHNVGKVKTGIKKGHNTGKKLTKKVIKKF